MVYAVITLIAEHIPYKDCYQALTALSMATRAAEELAKAAEGKQKIIIEE